MITRAEILQRLTGCKAELVERFDVRELGLFGSAARDDLNADSDVDLLVDFAHPPTLTGYMRLKFRLEEMLGMPVDLVTKSGLKPRADTYVQKDLIRVA